MVAGKAFAEGPGKNVLDLSMENRWKCQCYRQKRVKSLE